MNKRPFVALACITEEFRKGSFLRQQSHTQLTVSKSSNTNSTSTTTNSLSSANAGASTQPAIKQAPMVVDAIALIGEYDKNKLAAQDKYTGKTVQTTAIIDNISSDITGSYYLSL